MSALGCGCDGDHLCLFHAKVRDYQIRAAGSEKAQRFLESLAKMPPEPPESPSEPSEREDRLGHPATWEIDSDALNEAIDLKAALDWVDSITAEYEQAAREFFEQRPPDLPEGPPDMAIKWSGRCAHCHDALIKVRGTWICAGCDSIDLWPAMEGVRFYDQDEDQ